MAKEGQEKKGLDKNLDGSSCQGNREEQRHQRHLKVGTVDHSGCHLDTDDLTPSSCIPASPHRDFFSLFLPSRLYVSFLSVCAHVHKCKCLCV